ncbi:MAG: hypothetical protein RLZZ175_1931 [Bacteroidota bacterium]|jgi:ribonuclease HII
MLLPYFQENTIEAGLDEVGRGCLAGPVVAAAVILPSDFDIPLLNDSKKLSESKRNALVNEIKSQALAWHVSEVSHTKIDEINILNASFLAMHQALNELSITPELLLVDGNRFTKYKNIPHQCIVKGDGKYASIAAASILAKVYRDELMAQLHQQYPYYGWNKNVGYPTKLHREGIKKHGPSEWHRMSFTLLPIQTELFN